MANKVKFGLNNVYYAMLIDATVPTYAAPVAIPGAVNMSLAPAGDSTPFYADDSEYFLSTVNNGYDGTLEIALIPDTFLVSALGMATDANGVVGEVSTAVPAAFALMFEFAGDANAIKHVLYNCKATRANVESSTKTNAQDIKTDVLNLTVRPLLGKVKEKTTAATPDAVLTAWNTAVYQRATAAPALTVISLAGATTGKTKVVVGPALTGANTYAYKTAAAVALPVVNEDLTLWTAWNGADDITAVTGQVIVIAEITTAKLCVKAGSAAVVAKA